MRIERIATALGELTKHLVGYVCKSPDRRSLHPEGPLRHSWQFAPRYGLQPGDTSLMRITLADPWSIRVRTVDSSNVHDPSFGRTRFRGVRDEIALLYFPCIPKQ